MVVQCAVVKVPKKKNKKVVYVPVPVPVRVLVPVPEMVPVRALRSAPRTPLPPCCHTKTIIQ